MLAFITTTEHRTHKRWSRPEKPHLLNPVSLGGGPGPVQGGLISCGTARCRFHSLPPPPPPPPPPPLPPPNPCQRRRERDTVAAPAPGTDALNASSPGLDTGTGISTQDPTVSRAEAEFLFLGPSSQGNQNAPPPRADGRRPRGGGTGRAPVGRHPPEMICPAPAQRGAGREKGPLISSLQRTTNVSE
ncbi:hypothetical protein NHX12_029433 [Muraenolepis orangiensis]|uniref:Uncharacterized protein n=1 Tax=Muraenolepis orangiensis TaxID=630683 RepID=A0A9Q0INK6_9TELE|nr:hypothetical protein NHX12_029433 [Muraenolepis orangiensis]